MADDSLEASGGGSGSAKAAAMSVSPATAAHLLQLERFVLLTDEGAVAVRARLNGTVGYLKRQIHTQLHISPRLALTITTASASAGRGSPLRDDAIIAPFADGRKGERLLLSASPRPLSDFFGGASGKGGGGGGRDGGGGAGHDDDADAGEGESGAGSHSPLRQVRVRPMVRGVPQNFAVTVRVGEEAENTTVLQVQRQLAQQTSLLPMVAGRAPEDIRLYFSPVFITPDVLLGRKSKQLLKRNSTLGQAQMIHDDIIYLAVDND